MATSPTPNQPLRWANVSTAEARGNKVNVKVYRQTSQTPWKQLDITKEQRNLLEGIYTCNLRLQDYTFSEDQDPLQLEAALLLGSLNLDTIALEHFSSRWCKRWGQVRGKGASKMERTLY